MSDHQKKWHHRDHHANPPEGESHPAWRRAHKDWRLWVVVGLMLLAMLTYVMTMDEAVRPGGKVQEAVPAVAVSQSERCNQREKVNRAIMIGSPRPDAERPRDCIRI